MLIAHAIIPNCIWYFLLTTAWGPYWPKRIKHCCWFGNLPT